MSSRSPIWLTPPPSYSTRSSPSLNLGPKTAWLIGAVRAWNPVHLTSIAADIGSRPSPGFYLNADLFPIPKLSPKAAAGEQTAQPARLLLGPFCGKPACQLINVAPEKARGVCADAYLQRKTVLVQDVEAYPGHIACDGETKSEIVCPLLLTLAGEESERALGVLDLDCLALSGFDESDKVGLERIAKLVVDACDW